MKQSIEQKIRAWGNTYEQATKKERVQLMRQDLARVNQKRKSVHRDWPLVLRRFLAFLIDVAFMFVPMVFIAMPLVVWREYFFPITLLAALFMPCYLVLRDGIDGAGVGKRIMKICVIDMKTGQPISFKKSRSRYTMFFSIMLIVEPFVALFGRGDRGAGDYVAGTRVVRRKDLSVDNQTIV